MNEISKLPEQEKLQHAYLEAENIIFKEYLSSVSELDVLPLDSNLSDTVGQIRLQKVSRIVYDKDEDTLGKFTSIFSALHSFNCNVVVILKAVKTYTDIYIGTRKYDGESGADADQTLKAAMQGNFPGIAFDGRLRDQDILELLTPVTGDNVKAVASIAGVPSLKNDDQNTFSQGLEKIIEGMRGREYTAIIQASPVSRTELEKVENAFSEIYSALSVFETQNITFSENESLAVGKSLAQGVTETLSTSIGATTTNTVGTNETKSKTKAALEENKMAIGAKTLSGAVSGAASGAVVGAVPGAVVGAVLGGSTALANAIYGGSESTSISTNESTSNAQSTTDSNSTAKNSSTTDSDTTTTGTGKFIQITGKNRRVSCVLEAIDEQLKRLNECKNYGMWEWSAYFTGDSVDVKLGADLYSGILRGETSGLERTNISTWKSSSENDEKFNLIKQYVAQLRHPLFKMPDSFQTPYVGNTALISTSEMALAMSLPRKSLPGLPVYDTAPFGRSVTLLDNHKTNTNIEIGKVSNYGVADEHLSVHLDTQSLTGHTFVTGSTGAGKSNVIYSVLEKLHKEQNIPFLIIEPAKGEYKEVFGGYDNVQVFGTNIKHTPLLRLNPFSFPDNIHIMEHIDRLIEILNAVWPMYAAMPAILKEAIELTYERAGWDMINSVCRFEQKVFPDFHDLIEVLPTIINKSDYSDEIKGNYAGALVTRVRSMTNGYFKTIFQKDELNPAQLFDQSCIVDLSRVGSSETKSLLMGILFLKLQEYRISEEVQKNSSLRHITVLEEAHNLLRRTSGAQSEDSSNLQGKSVEMISNAIAEMRTYGEGFIIADQSPNLLDQSAIRNTNTKIILRLPDFEDRSLVGKAAHLNDDQINELASLKTGCAAVYQNNWLEPVLCQFRQFTNEKPFNYEADNAPLIDVRKLEKSRFVKSLVKFSLTSDSEILREAQARYYTYEPEIVESANDNIEELPYLIGDLLTIHQIINGIKTSLNNPVDWLRAIQTQTLSQLDLTIIDESERQIVMEQVIELLNRNKPDNKEILQTALLELNAKEKGII